MPRQTGRQQAARKFRRFIDSTGLTDAQVALRIGVSGAALSSYLAGKQAPRSLVRRAIERFTDGAVRVVEWETAEERERLGRVVPFKRNGTDG